MCIARFLQSNPDADTVFQLESQHQMVEVVMADLLAEFGENVVVDEHAHVVAHWPAPSGFHLPTLGFSAATLIRLGNLG